ncbi:MAG TPA: hypothetical protein VGK73_09450 [Polyangiaceae bacterium]
MASYDGNFGMWVAYGPNGERLGTFRTREEAQAAEAQNKAKVSTATDQEFGRVTGGAIAGGQGAGGGAMGFSDPNRRSLLGEDRFAADEAANANARMLREQQARLASVPYGTPITRGGTATTFAAGIGTGTGGTTGRVAEAAVDTGNRYQLGPDGKPVVDPTTGQPIILGPDGMPLPAGSTINGAPSAAPSPAGNIDRSLSEAVGYVEGDNDTQGIIDRVDQIIGGAQLERDAAGQARVTQALDAQQGAIDRVLSQESDARIIAEQMAAEQRGQALSARGGAAAQQQALTQAAANAPALQQAAFRTANQETTQRNALAGQIAGQMGQTALGSEQNDIRIQEANAGMADSFAKMVSTLGGVELQMNQADRHKAGQMVFDFQMLTQNTDLGWAKLGNDEKMAILDYMLGKYQIDETTAANIKMTAMNNEESFLDQLVKLGGVL